MSSPLLVRSSRSYRFRRTDEPGLPDWTTPFTQHPDIAGVLEPVTPGYRTVRLLTPAAAREFERCCSRRGVRSLLPRHEAMALVLDGVLELRIGRQYLSGGEAHGALMPRARPMPRRRLARLSRHAIRQVAAIGLDSAVDIARFLYRYNTRPVTAARRRCVERAPSPRRALLGEPATPPGFTGPFETPTDAYGGRWLSWFRAHDGRDGRPSWKLYVSPHPDHLADALAATLSVVPAHRSVHAVKVGADLANAARPDKLVVYCESAPGLRALSRTLSPVLRSLPGQGVPFTAQLGGGGLLSWGVDVERAAVGLSAGEPSWRAWVTGRLARALLQAQRDPACRGQTWEFAVDRLALDGVDVSRWRPPVRRAMHGDH